MSANVLRLWLNSSVYESNAPFYIEGLKKLGKELKIEIELKTIPWSKAADSLIIAFKNGNPPDVFQLGNTFIRTFAHLDYLAQVPDGIKLKPSLARWMDSSCIYKGRKVSVPWIADVIVMAARKDIINRYGIKPADIAHWEGFQSACELIANDNRKRKGRLDRLFPLVIPIRPDNKTLRSYISWLFSSGWNFPSLTPVPASILDNDSVAGAFKYISKLIQISDITVKDVGLHPNTLFEQFVSQDRYAFSVEYWGGDLSGIIRHPELFADREANLTIMPMPSQSGEAVTWGGGSNLAVSSVTRYPEASWKLLEYMCSDGFVDQWSSNSGDLPAFQSPFWEKHCNDKHLDIIYDQIKKSLDYPSHPMWLRIERYLSEDVANFLWRKVNGKIPHPETDIRSALYKMDQRVIDSLSMAWEIDNEE